MTIAQGFPSTGIPVSQSSADGSVVINVDSAGNTGTSLLNLQVNGTSQLYVRKDGALVGPAIRFVNGLYGLSYTNQGILQFEYAGSSTGRALINMGSGSGASIIGALGSTSEFFAITNGGAVPQYLYWDRHSLTTITHQISAKRGVGGSYSGPGDNLRLMGGDGVVNSSYYWGTFNGGNLLLDGGAGANGGATGDVVVGSAQGNLVVQTQMAVLSGPPYTPFV